MLAKLKLHRDKYLKPSMIRWGLVGVTTTLIDYFLFISLYRILHSIFLANLFSTFVATSINYFTHHAWTFKSEQKMTNSIARYMLNLIFWWLVSTTIIKILVVKGFDLRLAKFTPLILIVPVNYFVLNHLVFEKKSDILSFKK
jgi:putative flippase GtrA